MPLVWCSSSDPLERPREVALICKTFCHSHHGKTLCYRLPVCAEWHPSLRQSHRGQDRQNKPAWAALSRFHEVLAANGISPEEMIEDFKKSQVDQRKEVSQSARAEQGA
jgi:hypothetical protein